MNVVIFKTMVHVDTGPWREIITHNMCPGENIDVCTKNFEFGRIFFSHKKHITNC